MATQQSVQSYTYDRWGNRTINTGTTYGTGINNKQFTANATNNRLGVPAGQSGVMSYDVAGNLTNDTYTGAGNRTYDAENKITSAWGGNNQAQLYAYDAVGQRIKRTVDGVETWQVYGFGGELVAEYAANGAASSPQKEYGYRSGQLLITASGAPRINVAATANGGTATASQTHSAPYAPSGAINGDRKFYLNNAWANTTATFPQWLQVDFNGSKTIDEIDVFSVQNGTPSEPTPTMTFSTYGVTAFQAQYWDGSAWVTVPNGSVTGNNKVWKQITFSSITTTKIRIWITGSSDGYSRLTEVEAWGVPSGSDVVSSTVQWLVPDHLGTPRIIVDQTGTLASLKRHDYLPFGEELFAPTGGRTTAMGYASGDGVRQQFTQKERDIETGLDFFDARYYASAQGRFTSADPYDVNMERQYAANDEEANAILKRYILNPQHWNRYAYVLNNPLKYTDPTGETEEEIVVRLNIVYDKRTIRTEEEAKKLAGAAISDAQKVYGTIGIKLEVTFTAGTATGSVYQSPRQITEGRVEGAVNAFISQDRTAYTGAVYDGTTGDIFLNYGTGIGSYGNPADLDVGALSHELGHKFGVNSSAGYNNYTADSVIDNANAKLRRGERIEYYQLSSWFYMGGLDNSAAARGQVREIPAVKTYRAGAKRFAKQ